MTANRINEVLKKRIIFMFNLSLILAMVFSLFFIFISIRKNPIVMCSNISLFLIAFLSLTYNIKTKYVYIKESAYLTYIVTFIAFSVAVYVNIVNDPYEPVWFIFLIFTSFFILGNKGGLLFSFLTFSELIVFNYLGVLQSIENVLPSIHIALIISVFFSLFINRTVKENEEILVAENTTLENVVEERTKDLHRSLIYDTLTKLPNRHALNEDIEKNIITSIAIIDIKHYSQFNDAFSISTGDKILIATANRLQLFSEIVSKVYRLDSDRFVYGWDRVLNERELEIIEEFIKKFDNDPIVIDIENMFQSFIIELNTSYSDQPKNILLETASLALKYAKQCDYTFVVYDERLRLEDQAVNAMNSLKRVQLAIEEDRIIPVFQRIQYDDNFYYEALVRIQEGDNLVSPFEFLEDAKKTSSYAKITQIMIEKTFEFFKDVDAKFSLNLSYQDILTQSTHDMILEKLKHYSKSHNVIFEILESENIVNPHEVTAFHKAIKVFGAKLAIDDFGSGYSNFHYLADIEPDILKIDGSIVKQIAVDERYKSLAKNIVNLAHDLNIIVVAEFIHNKETFEVAQSIGVDAFQGYFIGKPEVHISLS